MKPSSAAAWPAGLSVSYHLQKHGVDHMIFEKHRIGHSWRNDRWDTFCLPPPTGNAVCRIFPTKATIPKASY
jgi:putative flavoprotein involved in K+ transport